MVHVSNSLGTINPVAEIIDAGPSAWAFRCLLDGGQAVPHLRVDVRDLDCDFYAFSGHKIYGPTGIGVLYGKAELLEAMPPYQGGGDMIRSVSFDKTTLQRAAVQVRGRHAQHRRRHRPGRRPRLRGQDRPGRDCRPRGTPAALRHTALGDLPGVRIVGTAADKAAVLSFVVDDPPLSALDVGTQLDLEGIAVRTGHHCCQPLMDRLGIPGTARASFAMYNTLEEVEIFALSLKNIVAEASAASSRTGRSRHGGAGVSRGRQRQAQTRLLRN